MSRQQMIDKHRNLFWYTPDDQKHDISDALLVERILNDGSPTLPCRASRGCDVDDYS